METFNITVPLPQVINVTVPAPAVVSVGVGTKGEQGDPGPPGEDGANGAPGQDGADGVDGADGQDGAPGQDGADGLDGEAGPIGPGGDPGSTWRDGSGPPSNALGIDGDYYLDALTGDVYFRSSGTYQVVANIEGPAGGSLALSSDNKEMVAEVTAAPFDLACATAVSTTPVNQGYVEVSINGVSYTCGDGVRTQALYFSGDGGASAKLIADVLVGDLLYVGSALGFDLDADDRISFLYVR